MNEMDSTVREAKRLMGHRDSFKLANSLEMVECGSLREIETDVNVTIQFKERLETP